MGATALNTVGVSQGPDSEGLRASGAVRASWAGLRAVWKAEVRKP